MAIVKIKMHTWSKNSTNPNKFKRNLAPREGFIDFNSEKNCIFIKPGEYKCKPWDTGISRRNDKEYIKERKKLYSGLCFESRKQAQTFMEQHKTEMNALAAKNPLFSHWSVMNVIKRFEPVSKTIYGKDVKEKI